MPENNDHEHTTIVPTDDVSEMTMTDVESAGSTSVSDDSEIDGFTRFGPGNIEGLRFKWTVRHVPEGYVVDETIGSSVSAFTTEPMSRETALAFMDARETEANQRFESLRQKFLDAQRHEMRNIKTPDTGPQDPDPQDLAPQLSPTADAHHPRASKIVETTVRRLEKTNSSNAGGINVDDVMDRIARLLDEH